jgi:spore maturation protein CgeB
MRLALFCHSLLSDWNHGNAHFLRGVVTELVARGHQVRVFEPVDAWSVENLVRCEGARPLIEASHRYPMVAPIRYDLARLDLERALDGIDAVLVHEWNDHELVARLGRMRIRGARFRLLFHDTHHRAVTDPAALARYDLSGYDGLLAFGQVLAEIYRERGLIGRAFVWHEAADTLVFRPLGSPDDLPSQVADLVFVGNWGDDERAAELHEFLLAPIADLRLAATIYGVRYPEQALGALARAGARYGGWVPNYRVPEVFARHRLTVHVPRRPYASALPGIPTIRPFEAMACGIPLVSAPWHDREALFAAGYDYLLARTGAEAKRHIALLLNDRAFAEKLADHGRRTILARHTCGHRVEELLSILAELGVGSRARAHPPQDVHEGTLPT